MKKCVLLFFLSLIFASNTYAAEKIDKKQITKYKNQFKQCLNEYQKNIEHCPEDGFVKCHNYKISVSHATQSCYKNIVANIFTKFYSLSSKDASEKIDGFTKYIHDQYFFVIAGLDYCKQNNCGTSVNLYSEYATTQALEDYANKAILTLETHL